MSYSPIIRRRVARELRRLRQRNDLTLESAAKGLDMSKSNLSRIENREVGIKPRDVRAALAFYGVTGFEAESIIDVARQGETKGWWHNYSKVLPEWFQFYIGLEAEAASIDTYDSEAVPGLFQTLDYAKAISSSTDPTADSERRVEARMRRQSILSGDKPARVSAILNEAVLVRPVGGTSTMRHQIEQLIELTKLPHVTIQVLPFDSGAHPAMQTPYSILRFADPDEEPAVHLDNITFGLTLEDRQHIDGYNMVHKQLREQSLTATESTARLTLAHEEHA